MASAYDQAEMNKAEEDELDGLFKSFDSQFKNLQQKITDIERDLRQFHDEKSTPEEDRET